MSAGFEIRVDEGPTQPTLLFLPGLHGNWNLVVPFRRAVEGKARFVEFTYSASPNQTLRDYAAGVLDQLACHGITEGWLLAESFGSQVAWALLEQLAEKVSGFKPLGLILAGGFVRYPFPLAVRWARTVAARVPLGLWKALLNPYLLHVAFAGIPRPERRACAATLLQGATREAQQAMLHRLDLVFQNDPRPVARAARIPVYSIFGLLDPIVPSYPVRSWLRSNCPSYRGGKTLAFADHNVLGTQPQKAARQILEWTG